MFQLFQEVSVMIHKLHKIWLIAVILVIASATTSQACVGRILYIGAVETTEGKIMAELLVTLINERTGTNVKIRYFADNELLYGALKADAEEARVDIIIENTADAMAMLKKERISNLDQEYTEAKKLYESDLGVIWLSPFGFQNIEGKSSPTVSAPLIRQDVLTNFPLLPRILNKLSGAIDDRTFGDLRKQVSSGSKPKNAAKNFLKARKFI